MGNISKKQYFQQPLQGIWHTIQKHQQYLILRNTLTKQEIEQRIIIFPTKQEFIQEFNLYYQRLQTRHKNIVQIKGFSQIQQNFCSNKITAHIYVERIPIRLNMLYQLSQQKTLYILIGMLDGFQYLYKNYKVYFQIFNDMIGFNNQKQVKVWINEQFYKNHPSQINLRFKHQPEDKIIKRIISLLQKSHKQHKFSQQFYSYLQMMRSPFQFPIVKQVVRQYQKHKKYNFKQTSPFKTSRLKNFSNKKIRSNKRLLKNSTISNFSQKLKEKLKQNIQKSKLEQTSKRKKYQSNQEKTSIQVFIKKREMYNKKKRLDQCIVMHFSKSRQKFKSATSDKNSSNKQIKKIKYYT